MHNVGLLERVVRIILGLIAIVVAINPGFGFPGWVPPVLIVIGLVLIITGVVGYCPIFAALGINTCEECMREEGTAPMAAMPTQKREKKAKPAARARKAGAKPAKRQRTKKQTKRTKRRKRS